MLNFSLMFYYVDYSVHSVTNHILIVIGYGMKNNHMMMFCFGYVYIYILRYLMILEAFDIFIDTMPYLNVSFNDLRR